MIALLIFSLWVLLVGCALALVSGGSPRGCGRDCSQGRNCTCGQENGNA